MPTSIYQVVSEFRCLGAECPDTCCRGWEMPADAAQRARYETQAPELLAAIDGDQGVMRRCGESQTCTRLQDGICTIHQQYGPSMLGDACYFYPRLLHRFAGDYVMSGAISCPEMLRLTLAHPNPFALDEFAPERLPQHRRDLLPEGITRAQAQKQVAEILAMTGDISRTPEASLEAILRAVWQEEAIPEAKPGDAHAIFYALALTEAFGRPGISAHLQEVMQTMEAALNCRFDRASRQLTLGENASRAAVTLRAGWHADAAQVLAPTLRRWLQAQIAMTQFPFGGFADATPQEKAAVLVQRFATIRLALMCHVLPTGVPPDEATVLRVIGAVARFQDHLADIKLTRMIHRDSGWNSLSRALGLVRGL